MKTLLTLLITIFSLQIANASQDRSLTDIQKKTETVPIVDVNIDETNQKIMALVKYNDGCYRPWIEMKGINENLPTDRLVITHLAEYSNSVCTMAVEYNWVEFDLSNTEPGNYKIIDGHNGNFLGNASVQ